MIIIIIFFLGTSCKEKKTSIVVVQSYERSYKGYYIYDSTLSKELKKKGINATIHTYYLDCENFLHDEEIAHAYNILDSARIHHPKLIIVNDDQATYSLLSSNHPLTKSIPILFAGVNFPNETLLSNFSNVTGFYDKLDFITNYEVAKELQKDKKITLYLYIDSTFIDLKTKRELYNQLLVPLNKYEIEHKLPLTHIDDEDIDRVIKNACKSDVIPDYHIRKLRFSDSEDVAGLLWNMSNYDSPSEHYLQIKRDFTVSRIARLSQNTSFTAIYEGFGQGEGFLAGYFTSQKIMVSESAERAAQILNGKPISELPITESKKEYLMDWTVAILNGYKLKDIPKKYRVINISLVEKYPILFGTSGAIIFLIIIILAVTSIVFHIRENRREKALLSELKRQQRFFITATKGSNIFIWRWDNGRFYMNAEFFDNILLEKEKTYLTDEEMLSLIHPKFIKKISKKIEEYYHNINSSNVQMIAKFSGKYEWWEVRHSFEILPNGKWLRYGIIINIQDQKEHEAELKKARDAAEKAELKESFMSNMSHEIRTPLNSIVGFSNILAEGDDLSKSERKEYADIIINNSKMLLKLVNDILEVSRIESDSVPFSMEKIPLIQLLEDVYLSNQILCPSTISFQKDFNIAEPVYINVDIFRIKQVLNNLLSNAFKFTSKGYVKLGATILINDELSIYVADTGIGIDTKGQSMVFSRFFKNNEFSQGTGLGLSICSAIVEKLNGRIELKSKPGVGSTFSIILPICQPK